jgi:hypothetical protein
MSRVNMKYAAMAVLGVVSITLGLIADLWYLGMVHQWLIPWSSLRLLAP